MTKHDDVKNSYVLMLDGKKMKQGSDVVTYSDLKMVTHWTIDSRNETPTVRNVVETVQKAQSNDDTRTIL